MKRLLEEERDRVNMWKFLLIQFGKWEKEDDDLFQKLMEGHKEEE